MTASVASAAGPNCASLAPVSNAATDWSNINTCLTTVTTTQLTSGTYLVNQQINVPSGKHLAGDTNYPTIQLTTLAKTSYNLVDLEGNAWVGFVNVNASNLLSNGPCSAAVGMNGSNNLFDDSGAFNGGVSGVAGSGIGVYVDCGGGSVSGNSLLRDGAYNNASYGVLFGGATPASSNPNTITDGSEYNNGCSGVGFIGYGVVNGAAVYGNGADCYNEPPGGGIYSGGNYNGGLIENSTIYDSCGHDIDLFSDTQFVINNNSIYNPGYGTPGGGENATVCAGAGIAMVNVANSTVENNNVRNGNPTGGLLNSSPVDGVRMYEDTGINAPSYTDVPFSGRVIIAFVLGFSYDGWNYGSTPTTTDNTITNNTFIANCSAPCVGIGYFTTRGTGFGPGNTWSASTTNYFTGNTPYGSNIGSIRGGADWFAANSTCTTATTANGCNFDDYQHSGSGNSWMRSDEYNQVGEQFGIYTGS